MSRMSRAIDKPEVDVALTSGNQLRHCEQEDIRHPELVQGIGAILVLDARSGSLMRWSENAADVLGTGRLEAGVDLTHAVPAFADHLQDCLRDDQASIQPRHIGTLRLPEASPSRQGVTQIELVVHQPQSQMHCRIVECIPLSHEPHPEESVSSAGELERLLETIRIIEDNTDLDDLLRNSVEAMQRFSEYDRVMVYRFDEDWHGQIVAEAVAPGLKQRFLDQHFPASDIPAQARALYERNLLRVIADVDAAPVRLLPASPNDQRLDQSCCLLRAPSPFHLDSLASR